MSTEQMWFVKSPEGEMVYGPYSLEELEEALQLGRLNPGHFISNDTATWRKVGDLKTVSATRKLPLATAFTETAPGAAEEFEHYQILEELGRGGMGVVYKAVDKRVNRTVALKVLLATGDNERQLLRFIREGQLTAQLRHPNIVALYEVGERPKPYFTMEYVAGRSLSAVIKENALTIPQMVRLFSKVCLAIEHAHRQKIVHRDLKPANILIDAAGEPKVTDFGIARDITTERDISYTGEILGTPKYMSPEQANGKRVDYRSDIYSLGAVFYELLVGRPPFEGNTVLNILSQLANSEPLPLRTLNPDIPAELEMVCLTCLHKLPKRRYLTVKLLRQDLESFLSNRPLLVRPPSWSERGRKWIKRNKILTTFMIGITIALGLVLYLLVQEKAISAKELHIAKLEKEKAEQTKQRDQIRLAGVIQKAEAMYYAGCDLFQQKRLDEDDKEGAYPKFHEAITDLEKLRPKPDQMANYYWMRGCTLFVQSYYNPAMSDFEHALSYHADSRSEIKLRLLMTLCAAENDDPEQALEYWKIARDRFYENRTHLTLEEYLRSEIAPVDKLVYPTFSPPLFTTRLTEIKARYYLLAHLLPPHMQDRAEEEIFWVEVEKGEERLLAREIHNLEYLLTAPQPLWLQILRKRVSFSQLKEMLVYAQGDWVLDMSTPYWLHLPLETQGDYASAYQQAYAEHLGCRQPLEFRIRDTDFSLSLVPPAQFLMGKPYAQNDEGPAMSTCIPRHFWMGQTEVTQGQWNEVLKKSRWKDPWKEYAQKNRSAISPGHPAFGVSWEGMQEFFRSLEEQKPQHPFLSRGRFDLPNEAEWEYSCKAGTTSSWYWHTYQILPLNYSVHVPYLWYYDSTFEILGGASILQPVKGKRGNFWQLYDMCGNIGELSKSQYHTYDSNPDIVKSSIFLHTPIVQLVIDNPKGFRISCRGGFWASPISDCYSTSRKAMPVSDIAYPYVGFRAVFIPD